MKLNNPITKVVFLLFSWSCFFIAFAYVGLDVWNGRGVGVVEPFLWILFGLFVYTVIYNSWIRR
jgi:hypothetical protein